jgi:subtilisin family serine protease
MAAPAVAGLAALIWSQNPKLNAPQVKKIIMKSGLPIKAKVVLGGEAGKTAALNDISTSGRIANAYNALIMAESVAAGKIKL